MDDLIKRQDAIDAVRKSYDEILDFYSDGHTVADSVEDIINMVPSTQPETHWILCSERNPDETGVYLVTVASNNNKVNTVLFNYSKDYGWTVGGCFTIVAWMPMPAPYKG